MGGCKSSMGKPMKVQRINSDGKREKMLEEREKQKRITKEENRDFQQTMNFLARVQLFKGLPKDEHPLLAMACAACHYSHGEVVIRQGDDGSEFFIIQSGEAAVTIETGGEEFKVATLRAGDYFGESALLRDEPRSATIVAQGELSALKITREKFKERGLNEKLQFVKRKAVVAGNKRPLETKPPSPKSAEEEALIAGALRGNENLKTLATLNKSCVEAMVGVAWKEHVVKGTHLIQAGDWKADYFYIVQEGIFEISVADQAAVEGTPRTSALGTSSTSVSQVTRGGSFGELALLYLVPRAATVRALTSAVVWVIDRLNFKKIMMKVSEEKIREYVSYLDRVEILAPLLSEERRAVAEALIEVHFTKGEVVLQEGEPGNTFYILFDGEVSVSKGGVEQTRLSASRASAEACFFGERALLNNERRAATVAVTSEVAKALALDRDSFDLLLGPLEDIIKQTQATSGGHRASMVGLNTGPRMLRHASERSRERRVKKSDIARLGLLGCGGFGAVELVEHRDTKETYAMKALSKGFIVKMGMQDSVMNEKDILMMTCSPFIIRLFETYGGTQTLYFLLEPALGGELYSTYNRKGFYGSEVHGKYYVAGVIEGFAHMHERRIIYRDLKPENLLINSDGQLKIADMGLAKFVIGMTYTTCGTPDYFAPELITSAGHSSAVDWWTLGILVFELMSGRPPFQSAAPMQIYAKVMQGIRQVQFPSKCQGAAERLIKSLLRKEPSDRLSVRAGGLNTLRKHAWFAGFDWESFKALTMEPPYKPIVRSKTDMANFAARKEDLPRQIDYKDDGSGWDRDFATM